jgi:hypothetical protein
MTDKSRPHINADGEFQSDKYPTCPAGKVPLSTADPTAQDLLWEYAQRRRDVDAEFADDLEYALLAKGHAVYPWETENPDPVTRLRAALARLTDAWLCRAVDATDEVARALATAAAEVRELLPADTGYDNG